MKNEIMIVMNYSTYEINGQFFFSRIPVTKCRENVRNGKSPFGKRQQ